MVGFTRDCLLNRRLEACSVLVLPVGGLATHHRAQDSKGCDSAWTE
jgi:putative hemolysin